MSRSTMRSWPTMTRFTSNSVRSRRAEAWETMDESVGSTGTNAPRNGDGPRFYVAAA